LPDNLPDFFLRQNEAPKKTKLDILLIALSTVSNFHPSPYLPITLTLIFSRLAGLDVCIELYIEHIEIHVAINCSESSLDFLHDEIIKKQQ
jgi:hypothetical protein